MPDLQPTAKLRWVERLGVPILNDDDTHTQCVIHILQQWWAPDVPSYMVDTTQGEWRDVPTE